MTTNLPTETVITLEFPSSPPSPPRFPALRSPLRITSTSLPLSSISYLPTLTPKSSTFPSITSTLFTQPPPEIPPRWLWRCHICNLTYPLGTTRRCLNDGHYFCAGTTVSRKTGRRKVHAACGSTFDYVGWKGYGDWRRGELMARTKWEDREERTARESFPKYLADFVGGADEDSEEQSSSSDDHSGDEEHDNEEEEELDIGIAVSHTTTRLFPQSITTTASTATQKSKNKKTSHDCEQNCNYPSECRWGQKISPLSRKKKTKDTKKKKQHTKQEKTLNEFGQRKTSKTAISTAIAVAQEGNSKRESSPAPTTRSQDISDTEMLLDHSPLLTGQPVAEEAGLFTRDTSRNPTNLSTLLSQSPATQPAELASGRPRMRSFSLPFSVSPPSSQSHAQQVSAPPTSALTYSWLSTPPSLSTSLASLTSSFSSSMDTSTISSPSPSTQHIHSDFPPNSLSIPCPPPKSWSVPLVEEGLTLGSSPSTSCPSSSFHLGDEQGLYSDNWDYNLDLDLNLSFPRAQAQQYNPLQRYFPAKKHQQRNGAGRAIPGLGRQLTPAVTPEPEAAAEQDEDLSSSSASSTESSFGEEEMMRRVRERERERVRECDLGEWDWNFGTGGVGVEFGEWGFGWGGKPVREEEVW